MLSEFEVVDSHTHYVVSKAKDDISRHTDCKDRRRPICALDGCTLEGVYYTLRSLLLPACPVGLSENSSESVRDGGATPVDYTR